LHASVDTSIDAEAEIVVELRAPGSIATGGGVGAVSLGDAALMIRSIAFSARRQPLAGFASASPDVGATIAGTTAADGELASCVSICEAGRTSITADVASLEDAASIKEGRAVSASSGCASVVSAVMAFDSTPEGSIPGDAELADE
jgi:hypothetical protein